MSDTPAEINRAALKVALERLSSVELRVSRLELARLADHQEQDEIRNDIAHIRESLSDLIDPRGDTR